MIKETGWVVGMLKSKQIHEGFIPHGSASDRGLYETLNIAGAICGHIEMIARPKLVL